MMFVLSNSNTTVVTCGAGTTNPSKSSPGFGGVLVARYIVFCVMFCRSLFVLLFFLDIVYSVLLIGIFKLF